jgi:hypothetical protein
LENRPFFNEIILGKKIYMVEPGRPKMTMWRMRIACWIPKATNTQEYVILITFRRCTNAPQCYVHTYIASFVFSYVTDKLLTDNIDYNLFEGAYSVERLRSFPAFGRSDFAPQ